MNEKPKLSLLDLLNQNADLKVEIRKLKKEIRELKKERKEFVSDLNKTLSYGFIIGGMHGLKIDVGIIKEYIKKWETKP